jgi:hypothetical protein
MDSVRLCALLALLRTRDEAALAGTQNMTRYESRCEMTRDRPVSRCCVMHEADDAHDALEPEPS